MKADTIVFEKRFGRMLKGILVTGKQAEVFDWLDYSCWDGMGLRDQVVPWKAKGGENNVFKINIK